MGKFYLKLFLAVAFLSVALCNNAGSGSSKGSAEKVDSFEALMGSGKKESGSSRGSAEKVTSFRKLMPRMNSGENPDQKRAKHGSGSSNPTPDPEFTVKDQMDSGLPAQGSGSSNKKKNSLQDSFFIHYWDAESNNVEEFPGCFTRVYVHSSDNTVHTHYVGKVESGKFIEARTLHKLAFYPNENIINRLMDGDEYTCWKVGEPELTRKFTGPKA